MEDVQVQFLERSRRKMVGEQQAVPAVSFYFSDHAVHGIVILPYPITPCLFLFHFLF